MSRKFGLGKGLGALIPEEKIEQQTNNDKNDSIKMIDINIVQANRCQPRRNFDKEKIVQLSESIKEHGIIQPIILKKEGQMYSIIAGERRWRAAKLINLKKIPAIIMNLTEKDVLEVSLIENIQRQDLNPIEEALAYKRLINDFELTQEQLSNRIGKSRSAITNCLRLLNLDKRVQNYLNDGLISEGHGRALLAIQNNDFQYKLAKMIIDKGLSVRKVEELIKNLNKGEDADTKRLPKEYDLNPYYLDIKNKLENLFSTKVSLLNKKNKGKIQIEYYSEQDLQRILDILKLD
ncbi:ParB/RepB/Spo0J family partition protein [Clostridium fermenticellae]|uniref:ParB/RepB/Spo0J family partition protein n=1 Tax=Clostridium fermenticellae TaxID=2068654 RepID=A0A386H6M7_9CLOT|nr:ParB/RepB/Spo0J family partition protein [Clostridium fermenticellae]AYD41372.1 ParB/RepB/Spo0J family partition protein [Clostridium fermenticellae]